MTMQISGFDLKAPDTAICRAALDLAREASPAFLYHHLLRSFAFGHTVGQAGKADYDAEMLFLGAIFHDLGLVDRFIGKDRFEIDGADAASQFLSEKGYPDAKIAVIWDAIVLHTTLNIPQKKQPEIALVQLGSGIDVGAFPIDLISADLMTQILEAYPRLGFKQAMLEALSNIVRQKPMTGMINMMGDVGRRCVDGFHIPNFCDVVHASGFTD